ncbi:MAG TPA: dihydrodipicolinate synthase family protein [Mycobacteriales bacterium]|jgi:4-hydroxy-tetrahydrodipicolinate synthase|nr:dihydrodipicolinate synthase family protein [Mycobacteriales bacterium]
MAAPFTGIGVALVTLFDDTKAIDEEGTADLAARLVDDGVSAVVVSGSTGEADTLEDDERRRLLDAVRGRLDGVPVLAGTGGSWAGQAARRTAAARDGGADAALVLSPRRVPDPRAYYAEVAAAAGDLPLLAYHYPAASGPGIPVGMLPELPVIGAKDSSGDPERLLAELSTWDGHLYPGAATLLSFAGSLGCPGAILALANAAPKQCAAAFSGDAQAQLALTKDHLASASEFPYGIKALVAARYGTSTVSRAG